MPTGRRYLTSYPFVIDQKLTSDIKMIFVQNSSSLKSYDVSDWPLPNKIPGCAHCSLARFDLANESMRKLVQPHTFYAQLLVFDETLAQPDFAVVNCSNDECVLLPCFNTQPDIFAVLNCCVVALSVFSSDVLTLSADNYMKCNDT